MCKEKTAYSTGFIIFRLLADWLQLWLLVVQPSNFDIPSSQTWWRILSFISLNQFYSIRVRQPVGAGASISSRKLAHDSHHPAGSGRASASSVPARGATHPRLQGYTFFLVCFYLLVGGLALSLVLSLWVAKSFFENKFDFVWPIVVLRWFAKIFFQVRANAGQRQASRSTQTLSNTQATCLLHVLCVLDPRTGLRHHVAVALLDGPGLRTVWTAG